MIQYRWMGAEEVTKIKDIDRSEHIPTHYTISEGTLQRLDFSFDAPRWNNNTEDDEHSVAAQIKFCQDHLNRNGRMYGAFAQEKLVGISILQPNIRPNIAQLAYLHVSNGHRQQGIGKQITAKLFDEAQKQGATKMYVSATPSESAVNFYLSCGFEPTNNPIPELFELEPDDIHMMKML